MPVEVWVSLVALVGVLLSVLVSLLISRSTVSTELRKLRFEAKKTYDSKLLDKRLDIYPGLYFLLSDFIKETHRKPVSKEMVKTLLGCIEEWDSKNAVYFSIDTANVCYQFRGYLVKLLRLSDEEFLKTFSSRKSVRALRDEAASLEFALKSDLGIYGIEDSDNEVYGIRFVNSFTQIKKGARAGGFADTGRLEPGRAPNSSFDPAA